MLTRAVLAGGAAAVTGDLGQGAAEAMAANAILSAEDVPSKADARAKANAKAKAKVAA